MSDEPTEVEEEPEFGVEDSDATQFGDDDGDDDAYVEGEDE